MKDHTSVRVYYEMIFRKTLRTLPRFLLMMLLTAAILLGGTVLLAKNSSEEALLPKINVAIVVEKGDFTTGMAARVVQKMDSVKSICNFLYISDEEALQGLQTNEIQAAIYLPKNLYQDINSGQNTPIRIRVSKTSGLGLQLFQDLVKTGLSMLQTGEAAVYSLYDTEASFDMKVPLQDTMDHLAAQFVALALNRSSLWNAEFFSPYGKIQMMDFYVITGILAFLCLLFGPCFAGLYSRQEKIIDLCLSRIGVSSWHRTGARILPMTLLLWLILMGISALVGWIPGMPQFHIIWIPALLLLAFSIACFFHGVFGLAFGSSGSFVYMILTLLLFLLGGGLFPAAYLPHFLQIFAGILPIRSWQAYLADLFWNGFSVSSLAGTLLWGGLMMILGNVGLWIHEHYE